MTTTSKKHHRSALFGALLVAQLGLGGCSIFSDDDDPLDEPAVLVEFESRLAVQTAWTASVGGDGKGLRLGLVPATNGARVFIASNEGRIAAFDAITGEPVWRTDTELKIAGGPGVGRDRIAVGTSEGQVAALAIESGEVLWTVDVGSEVLAAPAVTNNSVVTRTGDGSLIALDAQNGEVRWDVRKRVQGLTLRGTASPAVLDDLVITGFDDGTLAAYRLADGSPVWERVTAERRGRTEFDRLADVDGRVAAVGEDIFVVGFQGTASLLSSTSGSPVWRQDLSSHESVAVDWSRVYVTRADDSVVALGRRTGVIEWEQSALARREITGSAVAGSVVIVGDYDGYVHFLESTTGDFVARQRVAKAAIVAPPMVIGDLVYVLATDGTLTVFSPEPPAPVDGD
ncbi:MAG: outer membrane protein assembly factor BamB [Pseudomonadota bacterium]